MAWSRYPSAYYPDHVLTGDYGYFTAAGVEVFYDERPLAITAARESIVFFIAVVLIVPAFLFLRRR